jgi:cytochrome P450
MPSPCVRVRTPMIVGALPEMSRDFLAFVRRAHDEAGPFASFHALGKRIYLLSRPEHADHVFVRAHAKYDKGTPGFRAMRTVLGDGLITSDGARWKADRKRFAPMFRRESLGDVEGISRSYAREALCEWSKKESGRLDPGLAALVLRIVSRVILGIDIGDASGEVGAALRVLVDQSADRFLHAAGTPAWFPSARNRAYVAAKETLDVIAARFTREGRAENADCLLGAMLDGEEPLDPKALHDHLLTFLLAGHETTALALLVTLLSLDAHPEALAWIREPEIDGAERRARLTATLREAMRLTPPVWMLGRRSIEDDTIDSTSIPIRSVSIRNASTGARRRTARICRSASALATASARRSRSASRRARSRSWCASTTSTSSRVRADGSRSSRCARGTP